MQTNYTGYMPTKAQVQTVIDNFIRILPMAAHEGALDMSEGSIDEKNQCGTISCHGGWYAIACLKECEEKFPEVTPRFIDFVEGANLMAMHMGFEHSDALEDWAASSPKVWGNEDGHSMFSACGVMAFFSPTRPDGANTLADIVEHWKEVQDRLSV